MIKYKDLVSCNSVIRKIEASNNLDYHISTDSRSLKGANCFIALQGENFNANDFIDNAAEVVDVIIFCKKESDSYSFDKFINNYPHKLFIEVSDTYKYILELAEIISKKWQACGGQMIAITGSNGKTTNKEMLSFLLSHVFPGLVHKTEGNLNNHIGVPLTLFKLSEKHKVCIAEMGMNHAGELGPLAKAIAPTAGLITSIGPAHLEYLGTIDNILKEKKVLFDWIDKLENKNKKFVVRENDKYLNRLPLKSWCKRLSEKNYNLVTNGFNILVDNNWIEVINTNLLGKHNKENMVQSLFLALEIFPEHSKKLIDAAKSFAMPKMNRGDFYTYDETTVYLDAYNANPSSMTSSLDAFCDHCDALNISMNERLFILGDMNELGTSSGAMHSEIGSLLNNIDATNVIFIGKYSKSYCDGLGNDAPSFASVSKLKKYLKNIDLKYTAVFIKGSRSLQLESLIDINGRLNLN